MKTKYIWKSSLEKFIFRISLASWLFYQKSKMQQVASNATDFRLN